MRTVPEESAATAVVEAYGARLAVSAPDSDALRLILGGLPRGWSVCGSEVPPEEVTWRFAVRRDGNGYRTRDNHGHERECPDLELATWMLRTQMRRFVGYHSPELIFVHSGVVAAGGVAILIPGPSFAGKSTLVESLVRAGADFYSDEYAMLDQEGRVAQYREPLSIRGPRGQEEVDLGSEKTQQPAPVGLVVITSFRPGASWTPRQLTLAEGVVALMAHAVPARDRPAETLQTLRRALAQALILESDRGEADDTAKAILGAVASARS